MRSFLFVLIQFACIVLLFYTGPIVPYHTFSIVLALIAILLGLWAIAVMWMSKLSIFPDVRPGAFLVRFGPYRFLRHPMYLSVILLCSMLVLEKFSVFRGVVVLVLIIDLVLKIEYEEKLLMHNFPDYKKYKQNTWKLIPILY